MSGRGALHGLRDCARVNKPLLFPTNGNVLIGRSAGFEPTNACGACSVERLVSATGIEPVLSVRETDVLTIVRRGQKLDLTSIRDGNRTRLPRLKGGRTTPLYDTDK